MKKNRDSDSQNAIAKIRWKRGNGTNILGIGLVLIILFFFFAIFNLYQLKNTAYSLQLAADSISDAIAIFGYKERGSYEEASVELNAVKDMIVGNTSLLPAGFSGEVTLDRDMYENEDTAFVVIKDSDAPVISLFGDSHIITRSSKTYFPIKSTGKDLWYSDWGTTYSGGMGIPHFDMTKYNIPIPNGNLSADGCGIVALAMVESYCMGEFISVADVAAFSQAYVVGGRGIIDANTYYTTVPGANGYKNGVINQQGITGIRTALQNNQPVILLTANKAFTSRMHFVVIRGMTVQNGQYCYYVNDPSDGFGSKTFKENTAVPESYITSGYCGSWIF